jgi:hypothetical protein
MVNFLQVEVIDAVVELWFIDVFSVIMVIAV